MLIAYIIFFMGFFVLQRVITTKPHLTVFNGVIEQFHVMISVRLVLTSRKTGFIVGIVLNAVNLVTGLMAGQKQALPSLAISVCTVIIMAIIYSYTSKNDTMHDEFASRVSGGEFGIILGSDYSNQEIISFVGKIQGVFNTSVNIDGNAICVSSSIGVAIFPRDASNSEELFRCSEKSIFMPKNNGKNKVCFYSPVV